MQDDGRRNTSRPAFEACHTMHETCHSANLWSWHSHAPSCLFEDGCGSCSLFLACTGLLCALQAGNNLLHPYKHFRIASVTQASKLSVPVLKSPAGIVCAVRVSLPDLKPTQML